MPPVGTRSNSTLSKAGLGHLLVVYIIWSSTYLAIRIMVTPGRGFEVWSAGSIRMVLAGMILLLFSYAKQFRIKITVRELGMLFATGVLLWITGNGLVMWAEQSANSGFAALVLASTPIWSAFLESILNRQLPSKLLVGSLLISFAGIIVLMAPSLSVGDTTEIKAGIIVVLAAISWAVGSVLQTRYPIALEAPVVAGYQHLMGAIGFIIISLITGFSVPHSAPSAWLALGYLIIFGSVIAFTSFIKALQLLPINIAMTYAYVNPVLALVLGWWLLHESLTIWTLIGAMMVILGVFGVFQDNKYRHIKDKKRIKATENGLTAK